MQNQTTILISKEIRDELKSLGHKGETYDEIVSQLVELAKQHKFYLRQSHILKTERFVPLDEI